MTMTVKNPALFDRLRIQALLRGIADARGEQEMVKILEQALTTEFRRQDLQKQGKYRDATLST